MSKLLWEIQINITTRLRFQVLLSGSTSEIWLSNESMPGTSSPDKVCKIVTHSIVLVCLWQKKKQYVAQSFFQIFIFCCDIQRLHLIGYLWVSLIIDQSECLICFFLCTELTLFCTELTLFCTELPENCIYLNQSELRNFSTYIIIFKASQWSYEKYYSLSSTINSCTKIHLCSLSKRRGEKL